MIDWNKVKYVPEGTATNSQSPSSINWDKVEYIPKKIAAKQTQIKEAQDKYWSEKLKPKVDTESMQLLVNRPKPQGIWNETLKPTAYTKQVVENNKPKPGLLKTAADQLSLVAKGFKQGGIPTGKEMQKTISNIPKQYKAMTPDERYQIEKDHAATPGGAFMQSMTDNTPFGTLNKALLGNKWNDLSRISEQEQPGYSLAGKVGGNVLTYATVGKLAEGAKGLQAIKNPFLRNLAGQQLADTVVQTPGVIMRGLGDKKSVGEIAKDVGIQQGQDLAGNLIMSGAEALIKAIFKKLKAGKTLTQVEIETVNNTPELKALPEAKQYLMLPEGKITTPDVIEALPPKPTQADIDLLKTKPKDVYYHGTDKVFDRFELQDAHASGTFWGNGLYFTPDIDMAKGYGKNIHSVNLDIKKPLISSSPSREIDPEWVMKTLDDIGDYFDDDFATVAGINYGYDNLADIYKSKNFSDVSMVADASKRLDKGQLAEFYKRLKNKYGYDAIVSGKETIVFDPEQISKATNIDEALSRAKQYLEAKENLAYTVPEQFRKETPFTVAKSTVPPKVEGKFAKETFSTVGGKADIINPLGGKLPKAEPKPIGGELPKRKASSGIPIGEKPLSFPQTVAKSDLAADELKQMIKDNPLSYQPINNPDTLKYAQDIVDQNFEAAKRIVKEGESFSNATESAMAQDVIRRLQNAKQWDEAFEVMEATARKAKTSGQTIQAFSMWRRMTPEGMLRYADKVINETGGKMTAEFADKLTEAMKRIEAATDENTLRNTIMRQAGEMPQWAYKSMSSKTADQLKDIAMAQVLSDIADQVPKSAWRKASSVQAMSHLINAKTAAGNVIGNLTFGAAEKVSNAIAAPFDAISSLFTGKRTLTTPKFKGTFKAGLEQAKESAFDAALGIDRMGVNAGKYNIPIGSSFKGKLGKGIEKVLKYELNVPDEFFKGQIYDDVLKQQMSAAKVTEATQEMMEYATYRARYTTFQDDSLPARILQGFKDLANKIGGGAKIRGKSGLMTREFGLGDFLIKYTTVPGNLISRSIEYTPAGLLKILSIAKDANLSGAMKQSEIAMTIGRAITGTSMIAMGAALRRKGLIISEDKDRSKNAQSLDQAEGLGNYKVNISAVERLLDGGDSSPRDGDKLYSYNWIEPLGVQLAIGAEIDKEIQKSGKSVWGALSDPSVLAKSGNAAMEEILDLPTLLVIRQITYQDNVFDKAITPLVQGVSGFVPGPVRQYAQYQDPTARLTKGKSWDENFVNRLKSSLPSIGGFEGRKGLEPKIDPFGREVTYPGGVFNNFINRGQASTYRPSEVTPQLKQLEDLTGQTDFYPRDSAPSSFTHKKQPITLTPEEKTLYMQIEGKEVLRRYKEIFAKGVNNSNAEEQRAALNKAKTKASKMARDEILKRRGLK